VNRNATVCGIIPAYNARGTIAGVVRDVLRHLETVIVADDGSTDETAEVAREAGAEVIVLGENRGKGNALRALFSEARRRGYSTVLAIDADGVIWTWGKTVGRRIFHRAGNSEAPQRLYRKESSCCSSRVSQGQGDRYCR